MTESSTAYVLLCAQAEKQFSFLLERGFRFVDEEAEDTETQAAVFLAGRHVGLILSFDRRDGATSLYIAKVTGGRARPPLWDLSTYLRTLCGYRGRLSDGMTLDQLEALSVEERIARDVGCFAIEIRTLAPRVVDDTEDFETRGP